ncbi:organic hydroperoxide resistance protein [Spirilliplanes yamanashiensis]|uniref:Organic hydroperoxide resistance protein n=1 Tax=Spirilliplanes yamanashiensis TaxID=42233 RepID=A0A8J3YAU2_9ACTN|nr:organic hydroperoxide resistance protein [Spirilliplanes yamanashiensis]MDP9817617.1 Ohr subfamily peroxiredoxin [Spirilliplanes yamanashiensis]GIJ04427.1 organic hydroperoxide resistance protein [Spirilliplanes yamanashiensis]
MPTKPDVIYTARATAYGDGRSGSVTSDDDVIDLNLAVPKEMGGPGGELTNPEQLFAAGYAACFHSALKIVGRKLGVDVEGSTVTAAVGIGQLGPAFGLTVALDVALPNAADRDAATKALEAAHEVCPYSSATRGNIVVDLNLV